MLQFHRFSTCPACNVEVRNFSKRYVEFREAGFEIAMLFHSPVEELAPAMQVHAPQFPIFADPDRIAYDAYGVQQSWSGILSPAFMAKAMQGMVNGFVPRPGAQHGGMHGLPADFVIDTTGRLAFVHYGKHAGDTLDVAQALEQLQLVPVNASPPRLPEVRSPGVS